MPVSNEKKEIEELLRFTLDSRLVPSEWSLVDKFLEDNKKKYCISDLSEILSKDLKPKLEEEKSFRMKMQLHEEGPESSAVLKLTPIEHGTSSKLTSILNLSPVQDPAQKIQLQKLFCDLILGMGLELNAKNKPLVLALESDPGHLEQSLLTMLNRIKKIAPQFKHNGMPVIVNGQTVSSTMPAPAPKPEQSSEPQDSSKPWDLPKVPHGAPDLKKK